MVTKLSLTVIKWRRITTVFCAQVIFANFLTDVFLMSSCIATSRLIYKGRHIQKLLQLFNSPEILFGRVHLVTKVLLNLDRFYSILATTEYFKFWKSAIMHQFVTFRKRVCWKSERKFGRRFIGRSTF